MHQNHSNVVTASSVMNVLDVAAVSAYMHLCGLRRIMVDIDSLWWSFQTLVKPHILCDCLMKLLLDCN